MKQFVRLLKFHEKDKEKDVRKPVGDLALHTGIRNTVEKVYEVYPGRDCQKLVFRYVYLLECFCEDRH
jgi:hypothetical protein